MGEDTLLFLHLHKLSAIKSEEDLEHILSTLWRTRKTGLSPSEKSHIQSLLNLPSLSGVDPVLACLRALIRKCARENFSGDDLSRLFPPDLPLDLHNILIVMFQKFQNLWEETSSNQYLMPSINLCNPANGRLGPGFTSFSSPEVAASPWPWQDDHLAHFNLNNLGVSTPMITEADVSLLAPIPLQPDDSHPCDLGTLPRLKSMTWTLEKRNKAPTNKVVIISLKLQDYAKSPLGEKDVKFQLTRDTLEAMLRSMSYINDQLSSSVGSSSGALHKKQRQE